MNCYGELTISKNNDLLIEHHAKPRIRDPSVNNAPLTLIEVQLQIFIGQIKLNMAYSKIKGVKEFRSGFRTDGFCINPTSKFEISLLMSSDYKPFTRVVE